MSGLHPRGVNHLAVSTCDMKQQLTFWCDVLGLPLKALYWMHGVPGAMHGFVELSGEAYVAFVQHPDNDDEVDFGTSHAMSAGHPVRGGAMQHVALHVGSLDELLAMRDRIRDRGVQVLGPIDHGFCQSIYFDGPEGLNLEITCGEALDERAWVDPEVVALCGISPEERVRLERPAPYQRPDEPVPNPPVPHSTSVQARRDPDRAAQRAALDDEFVWNRFSVTEPPVSA